jgi:hypothetical protein
MEKENSLERPISRWSNHSKTSGKKNSKLCEHINFSDDLASQVIGGRTKLRKSRTVRGHIL